MFLRKSFYFFPIRSLLKTAVASSVFFHWQCKLKTSTWPSNDRFYNIIINNQICPVVYEKTVLEISTNQITSLAMVAMLNFWLAQKQLCVKHHPMNIHTKVDSNGPCSFGEEVWNVESLQTMTTDAMVTKVQVTWAKSGK